VYIYIYILIVCKRLYTYTTPRMKHIKSLIATFFTYSLVNQSKNYVGLY